MKIIDSTNLEYVFTKIKNWVTGTFWPKSDVVSVDTIDIDSAPTQSSNNLVSSGGVYAALANKYQKPSGGIPKTDLASAVQTSLGLADTALQSHQTIYKLLIRSNIGVPLLLYYPDTAEGELVLNKSMVGLGNVENFVYNVPTGAEQTYTYPV